jgi:ATP-dependent RNA helicase DeaD
VLYRRVENDTPDSGFSRIAGLELTPAVAAGLERDGIRVPTEVQLAAIPPVLEGRHVVIESGTGTGKTLAYLLPILQKLRQGPEARAVCMAPTTELAIQVLRVGERYKEPGLGAAALVTQGNQRLQATRLQKSTRLIVGTPSRVLEMYASRKLKGVNLLVLDEPEPILASRESTYLREVLSRPEPKLQLVFVGATFGAKSEQWIRELMGEGAVRTRVRDDPLKTRIEHCFVRIRHDGEKDLALARFLEQNHCRRAIVFVNQPNLVRHLYRYLDEQNLQPVTVSQDRTKQQCKLALSDFNQSKARVLLTTDSVATGLDVANVEWVLHYELPSSAKAYVHRAGRTGRAGQAGKSVAFVSDRDRLQLKRIERELELTFLAYGR